MEIFLTAADAGSFSAAAARLGVSSQVVARSVQLLEDRLKVRLLHRTTRRQSLTEFGSLYYQRCKTVLAEVEAIEAMAQSENIEPRGRLRISAPSCFGAHSLTDFVSDYLGRYAQAGIELALGDRAVSLTDDGFDLVFRLGEPQTESLSRKAFVCTALRPYRWAAAASKTYLQARGTPLHPAEMATHESLGQVGMGRAPEGEWAFTRDGKRHTVHIGQRLDIDDPTAQLKAALKGRGVLLAPEDMLRDSFAAGSLVRLLPGYEAPSRPLSLIYPHDRRQTPKLKSFVREAVLAFSAS